MGIPINFSNLPKIGSVEKEINGGNEDKLKIKKKNIIKIPITNAINVLIKITEI
jgi:hypothetical protein